MKPPACSPPMIRGSSIFARDKPALNPAYQPASSAAADVLAMAAAASVIKPDVTAALAIFMLFSNDLI